VKKPEYRCNNCIVEFETPAFGEYINGYSKEEIKIDFTKRLVEEYWDQSRAE
jgi:hypothetical protein